ncbi:unnamed protein product [Caenorhabditis auriculariae]|uniref:Uncharacterized protein n=1 Tax=Caenorhabditis auriculariae TaxID=2777116 RepID=A0A8S1HS75_9PELO|nr:unnamed protein product [Caenorhabditis auriculariae]
MNFLLIALLLLICEAVYADLLSRDHDWPGRRTTTVSQQPTVTTSTQSSATTSGRIATEKLVAFTNTLTSLNDPAATKDQRLQALLATIPADLSASDKAVAEAVVANLTDVYEFIGTSLSSAPATVQSAYADIAKLSCSPSFYSLPKKTRIAQVENIVESLSEDDRQSLLTLEQNVKDQCKTKKVSQQPYTLGNLYGNMLSNGLVLPK